MREEIIDIKKTVAFLICWVIFISSFFSADGEFFKIVTPPGFILFLQFIGTAWYGSFSDFTDRRSMSQTIVNFNFIEFVFGFLFISIGLCLFIRGNKYFNLVIAIFSCIYFLIKIYRLGVIVRNNCLYKRKE
jgi:hypothetical protein